VVIYCLDNSSFCCADQDGNLAAISKDKSDNKYHVIGELVVVHEITMAAAVTNLKQLLAVCGERKVFIITPCLRYANASCCTVAGHYVHRLIPDFDHRLLDDLRRLHSFFKQRLSSYSNCSVIPAGDLFAGKRDAGNTDIIAAYSSWGVVHGSGTSYTRMALYMLDNLFRVPFAKPAPPPNKGKRPRSEPLPQAATPATPIPDPRIEVPGGRTAPEATAATAVTAESPASPVAALAVDTAAATAAAPREASTIPVAAATTATPATESFPGCHLSDLFIFLFCLKKLQFTAHKPVKILLYNFFWCRGVCG
jgi:hypothetical protein